MAKMEYNISTERLFMYLNYKTMGGKGLFFGCVCQRRCKAIPEHL